jgi:hypothetical protein
VPGTAAAPSLPAAAAVGPQKQRPPCS